MSGQPDRNHRPQYGWDPVTLIAEEILGEPGGALPDETDAVERQNGLLRGTVVARVEAGDAAGVGTFGFILEGSNTGGATSAEWTVIGELNRGDAFDGAVATLQARVLGLTNGSVVGEGFLGEGNISFGRWKYLRVRTVILSGAPTFEMKVTLAGIAGDGHFDLDSGTLTRTSGDVTEPETDEMRRPNGVRYVTGQVTVTAMNQIGGVDGFNFLLQAAINRQAVTDDRWVTLDVLGPFTAAGTGFFSNGQSRTIDLAAFQYFRVIGEKQDSGAPPGNNSSYTAVVRITHDDNDWIDGEQGINQLNEAIRQTFVTLVAGPVSGVLPNREVTIQVCDMNMIPIRAERGIGLLLADTQLGGYNDLNAAATFTGVTTGSMPYGTGTNVCIVQTDSTGIATIQIATGGANPLYMYAWTGHIPNSPINNEFGPGQVVIASQRVQLAP
jgi:hypothetical protein